MIKARYFVFCLVFFVCACAAKENAPMKPTAEAKPAATTVSAGSLSATIDGQAWQATPAWTNDKDAATASMDASGLLTIRGSRASQTAVSSFSTQSVEVIQITLKSSQPGTYRLEPAFANLQTATFDIGSDSTHRYFIHEKQSGEAIITQSDGHRISGKFSFDARNTQGKDIHITNGTFDVVVKQ